MDWYGINLKRRTRGKRKKEIRGIILKEKC